MEKDRIFSMIYNQYGEPPNWSRPRGFVSLCRIILEQQVSLASAKAHFNKLNIHVVDFTPLNILGLSDTEMRACQVSRQKARYLRALASAVLDGSIDFDELRQQNDAAIKEKLMAVKGIGQWTADIYLMFCEQAKDVFPIGDIAISNTLEELTKTKSREDMVEYANRWKPNRSLASFFLWHYYLKKRNRKSSV
jgi:DNA-3-methyladenine glycosylase II